MMGFSSHFPLPRSEEWAEWAGARKSNQPQLVDMKATPLCRPTEAVMETGIMLTTAVTPLLMVTYLHDDQIAV